MVNGALKNLRSEFAKNYDAETFGPPEACDAVNDASRAVCAAFESEHGEVWLIKVNTCDERHYVKKEPGAIVLNFEADFIVPVYDSYLHELLMRWARGSATARLWDDIAAKVEEIGGVGPLCWS